MAARLNTRVADQVRQRIQASQLINRLQAHVDGKVELSPTQIQAAKILLDKSLSNAPTDMNMHGSFSVNWPLPKSKLDE